MASLWDDCDKVPFNYSVHFRQYIKREKEFPPWRHWDMGYFLREQDERFGTEQPIVRGLRGVACGVAQERTARR